MGNIGQLLKAYFKEHDVKQKELAKLLNCSQPFISKIYSGEKILGKENALILSNAFGFSFRWLLTGEGEMFETHKSIIINNNPDLSSSNNNGIIASNSLISNSNVSNQSQEDIEKENAMLKQQVSNLEKIIQNQKELIDQLLQINKNGN